jgi:hypothetical protein
MGWFRMPDGSLVNLDRLGLVWAEGGKVWGSTSPTQRLASVQLYEGDEDGAAALLGFLQASLVALAEGVATALEFVGDVAPFGTPHASDPKAGTGKGDATPMGPSVTPSP